MKRKTTAIMLTAAMMAGLAFSSTAVLAAPDVPERESVREAAAAVLSYDEVFKVPAESIVKIVNNAGHYGNSVIANAVDEKASTHWETNKPNNDSFKNKITVTFDKAYELSKLTYLVRQDGAKPKGFPLSYKLYYSTSETGDDFQLLKEGGFAKASGDAADMVFEPVKMRRIQLEFVQAQNNWASAAELRFYKYDDLEVQMSGIFTDRTCSALTPAYQDISVLEGLEARAMKHPNKDAYLDLLQNAKVLLENPDAFADRIFTASQRGNVNSESSRTQTGAMLAFDSTGYYVTPGETIIVYAEADPNGIMPRLAFGQVGKDKNDWRRFFNLKPGINVITAQGQDKMNPAAIYLSNEALPSQQAYAPKIRLVGGTKFPLYVHGQTSTEEFLRELEAYVSNVSYNDEDFANNNPNGYYYNIAEIATENTIITTSAAGAYKEVKALIGRGMSVEEKMDAWEDMYFSYAQYSGFDLENEDSVNFRPRGKFMSRVFSNGPYGWADYGYTGYNGGNDAKRENGFYSSMIGEAAGGGWAGYHEWGHIYENKVMQRGESTNNLFSLLMQDKYAKVNRMVSENRWEIHFTKYHNTKEYPDDSLFYGAIVYQLEPVYGQNLYGRAAAIARSNPDGVLKGCTNNHDRLVVCLSLAAGEDLTGHFEYYGLGVSDTARAKVAHLPKPEKKMHYNNDKSFTPDGEAFENADVQPVLTTSMKKGIVLKIAIDEPDNRVLCHEIYRDGEFLGVTYGDSFTDKNVEEDSTYTYTAITYDRKLNPSRTSNEAVQNTSEPVISVTGDTTLLVGDSFDPMSVVSAKDVRGNDITANIQLKNGEVDTSCEGSYGLSYSVTDEVGNSSTKDVEVRVVEEISYLSDLTPVSASVGWGKLGIDKAPAGSRISLLHNGQAREYQKGLGTHANATVVYDLSEKEYNVFETMLGIDQAMAENPHSSVTFEVWLDDRLAFESPILYAGSDAVHVQLEVAGAKQIILKAKAGANNWGDHAVWGSAKLGVKSSLEKDSLKEVAAFARKMTDRERFQDPALNHKEDRWESLKAVLKEALQCMAASDSTQEQIDFYERMLIYYLEENGQVYRSGELPRDFSLESQENAQEITDDQTVPEEAEDNGAEEISENLAEEKSVEDMTGASQENAEEAILDNILKEEETE